MASQPAKIIIEWNACPRPFAANSYADYFSRI